MKFLTQDQIIDNYMKQNSTRFRVVLKFFRGWNHKYWVQIRLLNSLGIGMCWYDLNEVTPHNCVGFRTKTEALAYKEALEKEWNSR